jgi:multiple sugar transport system substrate-binding protein
VNSYRGITWDHPRGRDALEAAAAADGDGTVDIAWSAHSLEHFESHPIDELARDYDLIVLDHPHLGEALEKHSLQPMDAVVGAEHIERWSRQAVGPSFDSYTAEGYQWALPLDAATQVAVHKPALVPAVPETWGEVEALSRRAPVALSLAGPHAFLTFASICVAFGAPVPAHPSSGFVPRGVALEVLELMTSIGSRIPAGSELQNPIALLQRLTDGDDIAYCPLVYGYVTYSSPAVRFAEAPAATPGGRRGSTIGGTGLAVSARCEVTPELVEHIAWLMSPETQRGFIPQHAGQPSSRESWTDPAVDSAAGGFYSGTLETIEQSWVRPRYSGYIPFQTEASAIVRAAVLGELGAGDALDRLEAAFAASPDEATPRAASSRAASPSAASPSAPREKVAP